MQKTFDNYAPVSCQTSHLHSSLKLGALMTELSTIETLAGRFDKACDTIYTKALANDDTESAVAVAKAALSTAVRLSMDLNEPSYPQLAIMWFDRMRSLYVDQPSLPSDIARTLEWAGSAINRMLQSLYSQALDDEPQS